MEVQLASRLLAQVLLLIGCLLPLAFGDEYTHRVRRGANFGSRSLILQHHWGGLPSMIDIPFIFSHSLLGSVPSDVVHSCCHRCVPRQARARHSCDPESSVSSDVAVADHPSCP